jgi:hypothetical protein
MLNRWWNALKEGSRPARIWIWKRRWRSFVALLFLASVLAVFLVGASESVRKCEYAEHQYKPGQLVREVPDLHAVSGHCVWTYLGDNDKQLVVLATVVLVIVTGGLTVYTARLWGSTNRLAKDARKATRLNVAECWAGWPSISSAIRSAGAASWRQRGRSPGTIGSSRDR